MPIQSDDIESVRAGQPWEDYLAAIVQSFKLGVISLDEAQNIVLFNTEAEQIFRCAAAEALGGSLDRFIPASLRAVYRRHVAEYDGGAQRQGVHTWPATVS